MVYTNSFGGNLLPRQFGRRVAGLIFPLTELKWDQVRQYMRDTADKIEPGQANYVDGYSLNTAGKDKRLRGSQKSQSRDVAL